MAITNNFQLDALQTIDHSFFVYLGPEFGVYLNEELDGFDGVVKHGPIRRQAFKEWEWAKDEWENSETIILTPEQTQQVFDFVQEKFKEYNLGDPRLYAETSYAEEPA